MKIFISWSGERSKKVANALRDWIPSVIQSIDPWMSSTDIDAGARWSPEIQKALTDSQFGIICLTQESLSAPWIFFEAGALSKTFERSSVCPYLIGLNTTDIPQGPLTQFQAKQSTKEDTLSLIKTINAKLEKDCLNERKLNETFALWWPQLEEKLKAIPTVSATKKIKRTSEDMIEEILGLVREMERRSAPSIGDMVLGPPSFGTTLPSDYYHQFLKLQGENSPYPHSAYALHEKNANLSAGTDPKIEQFLQWWNNRPDNVAFVPKKHETKDNK